MITDDLIRRIEQGSGADRGLDAEIAFALGHFDHKLLFGLEHCRIYPGTRRYDEAVEVIVRRPENDGGGLSSMEPYPRFTGSVDSGLALVAARLPRYRIENLSEWEAAALRERGEWMCQLTQSFDDFALDLSCPHAKSPARALLSAALRCIRYEKGKLQ